MKQDPATFPNEVPSELRTLLESGRYSIHDFETLQGVLADAFALYDIEVGRARLSDLLAVIEKRAHPEVFSLIVFDLAKFLGPRLPKILSEISELQQEHVSALANSFGPTLECRVTAMQAMKRRIRDLSVQAGITDAAGVPVVEAEISRQIRSDAAALSRIERGDLSDVDRLFRERMSAPKGLVQ
jgi:hypothetical protein